ncbi:hypothetical protein [Novosphingobium sp. PASSN1]|uniref:hypothetical protein n=1 Tax=Novosphingobium sp. PASSN1 TaxID=2015561 RepID=UPI0025EF9BAC|nr:hypothetical protein [Novosphingobium sp. PASSN1]
MTTIVMGNIESRVVAIDKIQSEIYNLKKKIAAILLQTEDEFGAESQEATTIRTMVWG